MNWDNPAEVRQHFAIMASLIRYLGELPEGALDPQPDPPRYGFGVDCGKEEATRYFVWDPTFSYATPCSDASPTESPLTDPQRTARAERAVTDAFDGYDGG